MAEIKTVGVIGAGQMGGGIAHVCALAGYEVLLNDISLERVTERLGVIEHNLARQVARGVVSEEDRDAALARIHPVAGLDSIGAADLAIEAVDPGPGAPKTRFVSDELVKSDRPELAAAKIVVSGGRAMGSA